MVMIQRGVRVIKGRYLLPLKEEVYNLCPMLWVRCGVKEPRTEFLKEFFGVNEHWKTPKKSNAIQHTLNDFLEERDEGKGKDQGTGWYVEDLVRRTPHKLALGILHDVLI